MTNDTIQQCPIELTQIKAAIDALKKVEAAGDDEKTLLNDNKKMMMTITLHKIPAIKNKRFFLQIPHSLYTNTTADVCLITKDVEKTMNKATKSFDYDKTIEEYEDRLHKAGVENIVTEVLPITKLKLDYKSHEARRKLCDLHDLFLCENSILHRMSSLTGKYFLTNKKQPRGIEIKSATSIKHHLEKAMKTTEWYFSGNGNCSSLQFAKTDFPIDQIVENLSSAISGIAKFVPRGWNNVRSLHIKTANSMTVPLYINDECDEEESTKYEEREINYIRRKKQRNNALGGLMRQAGLKTKNTKRRAIDDTEEFEFVYKKPAKLQK